ncbi:portal protein, partial [Candidatus Woesearchaeota archaeon]|nr:portal protein [Candidatus Woesearchaeota archaeon]
GFKIERKNQGAANASVPAFTMPENDDGSMMVSGAGAYGTSLDLDGQYKTEIELILKYREMAQTSDCEIAIDNIINESIVIDDTRNPVDIILDKTNLSDGIKKKVINEFNTVLDLLNFNNFGYDIFRRWYVEGKLYYHIMIDENNPNLGIVELRSLDATKIKKVKQINQKDTADPKKKEVSVNSMFNYNESGLGNRTSDGILISGDSIAYSTSGLLNPTKTGVLSYLHKAIKPLNQLRMVEDAIVIYRISRAPERRIFYIDVGNLPKLKAEQYIRDIMTRYKNKLVYDSTTGEVKDDRRHQSMLEDYWLPRREGGRGTEITTLPGGENLGQLEDVEYFQKKMYKAMHVPVSRLEADSGFSLGRESEITRDELLFSKFIGKLQTRFSMLFGEILEKQLLLKNIITSEEWSQIRDKVHYKFEKDHYYTEFKQQETMTQRVDLARNMEEYVGNYYSREYFRKNILRQSEEEIRTEDVQIEKEKKEGDFDGDMTIDDV